VGRSVCLSSIVYNCLVELLVLPLVFSRTATLQAVVDELEAALLNDNVSNSSRYLGSRGASLSNYSLMFGSLFTSTVPLQPVLAACCGRRI